ncbi:hypothetical protein NSERKGN1266_49360 [Nocardia seriolae]|nr:hypothetical protein NSERKGN1266_49360 [Nocardia seriolae]
MQALVGEVLSERDPQRLRRSRPDAAYLAATGYGGGHVGRAGRLRGACHRVRGGFAAGQGGVGGDRVGGERRE